MAQLWGGRFTKETDKLVYNFNASISFDQKFYKQDIKGSMAHVKMLAKQGILTEDERDQILEGLEGILADVESGKLKITSEYEDIHSFVEANLIDRIGDAGKKLHTGRSRNDQVALDMKLYVRDEITEIDALVKEVLVTLEKIMEENIHTYMPRQRPPCRHLQENELLSARFRCAGWNDVSVGPRLHSRAARL